MGRGRKMAEPVEEIVDPSAWMIDNDVSNFLLMHTREIKYMCMFGYTFLHGAKVFSKLRPSDAVSYKFINMIVACTGGGILVPIFINKVPVPLAQDAYPIAIFASFLIHYFFPIVREVLELSVVFKGLVIVLYETMRAFVVVLLTTAAGEAIAPSSFSFPVFGPIMCGTIAGCGGAFLPLNKGLDPIKSGLQPPMLSALVAATCFHLFLNSPLSDGVIEPAKKAHVHVTCFFIVVGLASSFNIMAPPPQKPVAAGKKEK